MYRGPGLCDGERRYVLLLINVHVACSLLKLVIMRVPGLLFVDEVY